MVKIRVGWANRNYNNSRLILGKVQSANYVHSRSYASAISSFCRKIGVCCKGRFQFSTAFVGGTADSHVDFYHFFNLIAVGLCKNRFITSFETSLPRNLEPGDYWYHKCQEALVSPRCVKLLALSECARQIQKIRTQDEEILGKTIVLHPPQEALVTPEELERKDNHGGVLRFFFVGRDFFRKGGGEALRALARIRKDFPVEVWVVGDYRHVDYASSWAVDSWEETAKLIAKNSDWIHYEPTLPNQRVLELMKTCDVGLLPTRADTYGYSVLEMQACGLPVITTDVRALPEINNDKCGWVIEGCGVRDGAHTYGEANYSSPEKLRQLSMRIEDGIYKACVAIASNPGSVREKGVRALARIQHDHDPVRYGVKLEVIYNEALA